MDLTRRSVLIGAAGLPTLGDQLWPRSSPVPDESDHSSVGVAIWVDDTQQFRGLSRTVTLERVRDPWAPGGGGQGNGGNGNGGNGGNGGNDGDGGDDAPGRSGRDVLHVTSAAGRGRGASDPAVTFDIALSLVDVSERELTVADIATYDGDGAGFAYDWGATEADVVGVDTDHEGVGSPDDVWLFLDTDPEDESESDGRWPQFRDSEAVFRTLYADRDDESGGFTAGWGYDEWNTRDVTAEFDADGWKRLDLERRRFERLNDDLQSTYGGSRVVGVGISRGDPYWGPSTLDAYYRDLTVAGTEYAFPAAGGPGRGRPR